MGTERTGRAGRAERTWRAAAEAAQYGPRGFHRTPAGPRAHFRTSVHASPAYAAALARLAGSAGLGTVVDVGAGRGELAAALAGVAPGLAVVSVEIGAPGFAAEVPEGARALLVANEWLDDVPLDVVELTPAGPRVLLVDEDGAERPGPEPDPADLAWLERWWPLTAVGQRAEVGRPRDEAWAAAVGRLRSGLAVAADYAHTRDRRPYAGTLTGYRDGRQVPPVPDGSCNLTAHVALDACAAATAAYGPQRLTTQRKALRALGVTGARPAHDLAAHSPAAYVTALAAAGAEAELLDPGGLGGFGWLVQAVGGTPLPAAVSGA